jgi:hypothetical protein
MKLLKDQTDFLSFKGHRHTDESKKKIGNSSKGNKYSLGYKHSDKTKRIIAEASIQRHKNKNFGFKKGHKMHLGRRLPKERIEKMRKISASFTGENAHNWKGGISKHYKIKKIEEIKPRPNKCEICGEFGKICYDHDHKTGNFRGWVCSFCNFTMGFVKDDVAKLEKIIIYLNKNI